MRIGFLIKVFLLGRYEIQLLGCTKISGVRSKIEIQQALNDCKYINRIWYLKTMC